MVIPKSFVPHSLKLDQWMPMTVRTSGISNRVIVSVTEKKARDSSISLLFCNKVVLEWCSRDHDICS